MKAVTEVVCYLCTGRRMAHGLQQKHAWRWQGHCSVYVCHDNKFLTAELGWVMDVSKGVYGCMYIARNMQVRIWCGADYGTVRMCLVCSASYEVQCFDNLCLKIKSQSWPKACRCKDVHWLKWDTTVTVILLSISGRCWCCATLYVQWAFELFGYQIVPLLDSATIIDIIVPLL